MAARHHLTANMDPDEFNRKFAENNAMDGAAIARKARSEGNLQMEEYGNKMMDNALAHLEHWKM